MSNNENKDLELVAGLWITAKASNLYGIDNNRAAAWNDFEAEALFVTRRYGYTQEQFGIKLRETAARLYATQLKTEIFGYAEEVAA